MFALANLHRRSPFFWHDPAGRIQTNEHAGDGLYINYQYAFDRANRLTGIDRTGFGPLDASDSALFGYDDRDQLISASHTYAAYLVDETYAYDPTGNRTESHLHGDDYETAADNRLESDGTYWFLFDNEGNVTEKRLGSDTGTLVARYTWDHRNRLTLVEIFDESTGDPLRTVGYAYDTFDRRIARWLDEGSDSSIQDRDFYYYDGSDVALVLDENLEVEHRRLFGPAVDMILADETRDPSTGDLEDVYWALADHQGTVRDVATFDSGVTTHFEHVETDSYGRIVEVTRNVGGVAVVDSSNATTLAYVFTGREWDPVVQLAYHLHRWYDPGVGRWLSQDPIGFGGLDQNLYRYVFNGTPNAADPNGENALVIGGVGIGIAIGVWGYRITEWGSDWLTAGEQKYLDELLAALDAACNEVGTADAKQIARRLKTLNISGKWEKGAMKNDDGSPDNDKSSTRLGAWFWPKAWTVLRASCFETDIRSQAWTLIHESWHCAEQDETEKHTYEYAWKGWELIKNTAAINRFITDHPPRPSGQ